MSLLHPLHNRAARAGWVALAATVMLCVATTRSASAANCISAGSGTWTAITWTNCTGNPGGDPVAGDTVTIRNGDTVTLNTTTTIAGLTVGQGASGTLTLGNDNTNRALTITGSVSVSAGATLNTAGNGGNVLNIGGSLTNNGTFDMAIGGATADVTFNGAATQTVSGTGATTDFNNTTINAGSGVSLTSALNVTVQGNVNLNGSLAIAAGTMTVGTTNANRIQYGNGAVFAMTGGALSVSGGLSGTAAANIINYTQSGGTVTVGTVAAAPTNISFDIGSAGSSFTMSGGSIVLQQAANASDYRNLAGTVNITGGTLQVGNGSTAAGQTFGIGPTAPGGAASAMPSLVVNSNVALTAVLQASAIVYGDVTINTGRTLTAVSIGGGAPSQNLSLTGNWTSNGTFTSGTGTVTLNGSGNQSIGGTVSTTFNNLATATGGTKTLITAATVSGTLTVGNGTVFAQQAALTDAAITVNAGGTFRNTGGTLTNNGAFTNNGVVSFGSNLTCTTGTVVTVNGTGTWSGSGGYDLYDVNIVNPQSSTLPISVFSGQCNGAPPGTYPSVCNGFQLRACASAPAPTAVRLDSFTATDYRGTVLLEWHTGLEVDNLGFNVYRGGSAEQHRLNRAPISGSALLSGPGVTVATGRSYAWRDPAPTGASYWLESIDIHGERELHGPVGPTASLEAPRARTQAPLLRQLSAVGRAPKRPRGEVLSRLSHRVVSTRGAEPFAGFGGRPQAAQFELAAAGAIKIFLREEGWYRLTQPDLAPLGADIDPRNLQLFADGVQVPILVRGQADGRFDPEDTLEFYGTGLDTPSTDTRVYWLVEGGRRGVRTGMALSGGRGLASSGFPFTEEAKPRDIYFPALGGDGNKFFGPLITNDPEAAASVDLTVRHLDPIAGADSAVEVVLQGVTDGAHDVRVLLNDTEIGRISFTGQSSGRELFDSLGAGLVREGTNQVRLEALGGVDDLSLVDVVRLTYPHAYTADDNALKCTADSGDLLTIGGFAAADIQVLDVTNPARVRLVESKVESAGGTWSATVSVPPFGRRTLLAVAGDKIAPPDAVAVNRPSSWHRARNGADMIVISHADFLPALASLVALRQAQGLKVALLDVEDLYDEFGFGAKTPQAIRDFVTATAGWTTRPRFVLLVGDASSDPRDYLGYGYSDFVPTKLVQTRYTESASDDWFVEGDFPGLPNLAIGRIPVRTATEAAAVVAKIVGYESGDGAAWTKRAILVADLTADFDFEAASSTVGALLPSGFSVQRVFRSTAGDAAAHQAAVDGINAGALVVNYFGHGTEASWNGGLLAGGDSASLTNGTRLPFVTDMTCWNGWFSSPYGETLAESLLKAPQGGAVAVWASSALTEPSSQLVLDQALYRHLFQGPAITIGEAAAKAKAEVADEDVRRSWILFGDPALRLH
jgi:hypothetical protein